MLPTPWLKDHGDSMSLTHSPVMMLPDLLQQMSACAIKLENIAEREQQAASRLDADTLIGLSEERVKLYEKLAALENACHDIVHQTGESDDMPLSVFIDRHAGNAADTLQVSRRETHQRLIQASGAGEESMIRLHAMYEATSGVLRDIGAMEQKSTYGPGGSW